MKISELTPTEVLNDEDIFPVVQDGETKNVKRKDLFKHISAPTEDDDVASKMYVDEKVKKTVDEQFKKEAQNIKKYVDDEATKKWYVMPVDKFKENSTSLYCKIRKRSSDNGYCAIVGFYFHHAERGQDGEEIVIKPLTDIPFELGLKDNGNFTEWLNKDKFPAFGIINTQMGKYPVDLYEQLKAFVDGTTFYDAEISDFGPTGNTTIYYDFGCSVALYSHSEVAIDAFIEEMTLLIPTITHCCIAYENYQIVEANTLEVE